MVRENEAQFFFWGRLFGIGHVDDVVLVSPLALADLEFFFVCEKNLLQVELAIVNLIRPNFANFEPFLFCLVLDPLRCNLP